jgi:hypothetical protein
VLLPPKTLLLIVSLNRCDPADFIDIGQRISKIAPDIDVRVLHPNFLTSLPAATWKNPTLLVSLARGTDLTVPRGAVLMSHQLSKLQQAEMFRLGGIPTPMTASYEFGMRLDPKVWGELILMKPKLLRMTSHGAGIQVFRTSRLSGMTAGDFPPSHMVNETPMLIQQFVDTGPLPQKYRALTLCGDVLYIAQDTNVRSRPELSASDKEIEAGKFHNDGAGDVKIKFGHYPEIHEFARKMASAFPAAPLLGCDIIKDAHSGQLYALEVNAGGNVWHFSSRMLAKRRAKFPGDEKARHSQYGAFDVAAKALIRATRQMAM